MVWKHMNILCIDQKVYSGCPGCPGEASISQFNKPSSRPLPSCETLEPGGPGAAWMPHQGCYECYYSHLLLELEFVYICICIFNCNCKHICIYTCMYLYECCYECYHSQLLLEPLFYSPSNYYTVNHHSNHHGIATKHFQKLVINIWQWQETKHSLWRKIIINERSKMTLDALKIDKWIEWKDDRDGMASCCHFNQRVSQESQHALCDEMMKISYVRWSFQAEVS